MTEYFTDSNCSDLLMAELRRNEGGLCPMLHNACTQVAGLGAYGRFTCAVESHFNTHTITGIGYARYTDSACRRLLSGSFFSPAYRNRCLASINGTHHLYTCDNKGVTYKAECSAGCSDCVWVNVFPKACRLSTDRHHGMPIYEAAIGCI